MLELLFFIGMLWIFGKLFFIGIQAAWGIGKILLTVVFFPVILIVMVLGGLLSLAFPILLIAGGIAFFTSRH